MKCGDETPMKSVFHVSGFVVRNSSERLDSLYFKENKACMSHMCKTVIFYKTSSLIQILASKSVRVKFVFIANQMYYQGPF